MECGKIIYILLKRNNFEFKTYGSTLFLTLFIALILVGVEKNYAFADVITTLDSTDFVGKWTSIAIGNDGNPIVSYYDDTNDDLKVVHCTNASCSTQDTPIILDSAGNVGAYTSIAIDKNNFPIVSYWDVTNSDLKVITQYEPCSPINPGTWNIGHDCSLDSSDVAPENVLVQNNSQLVIFPGVTLDVDFANYNITIKSGSGILLKLGGTIT